MQPFIQGLVAHPGGGDNCVKQRSHQAPGWHPWDDQLIGCAATLITSDTTLPHLLRQSTFTLILSIPFFETLLVKVDLFSEI